MDGSYECKEIIQALEKYLNSIIHLETTRYAFFLHFLIPKLIKVANSLLLFGATPDSHFCGSFAR